MNAISYKISPFLVLNLSSELLFVISQRLDAQKVDHGKSRVVMDEISASLFAPNVICDLFTPKQPYAHAELFEFFESAVHTSIIQLDKRSMSQLWNLITMIYKWQTTMTDDIVQVTYTHLTEIQTLFSGMSMAEEAVKRTEVQLDSSKIPEVKPLNRLQIMFTHYLKQLNRADLDEIRKSILLWLKPFNIRVSILVKMGLQSLDGSFIDTNVCDKSVQMLRNLGTNIYAVEKAPSRADENDNVESSHLEIDSFASEIFGGDDVNELWRSNLVKEKLHLQLRANDCLETFATIPCLKKSVELRTELESNGGAEEVRSITDELLGFIDENTI